MGIRTAFNPMGGSVKAQGDYPFSLNVGGVFDFVLVGAGGGGYGDYFSAPAGSSGAAFEGEVFLAKGDYVARVGQASHGNGTATVLLKDGVQLITAGGGASRSGAPGTLTISPDCQVIEIRVASNGRQGGSWPVLPYPRPDGGAAVPVCHHTAEELQVGNPAVLLLSISAKNK